MNELPILPWEMVIDVIGFVIELLVNKTIVEEFRLMKEVRYGGSPDVMDSHVLLPSRIKERRRKVEQRAMYRDITYEEELRSYHRFMTRAQIWMKARDENYTTRCAQKLIQDSSEHLLTLWTIENTTLPYFSEKTYEI